MVSQRGEQQMDHSTHYPQCLPHPHADTTNLISCLRGCDLIFSYRPPKPPPHCHLVPSSCPVARLLSPPFTFSVHPAAPPPVSKQFIFPFVIPLKNPSLSFSLLTIFLYLPAVPSSSPQLPPSHTCCSLTLPLL